MECMSEWSKRIDWNEVDELYGVDGEKGMDEINGVNGMSGAKEMIGKYVENMGSKWTILTR